MCALNHLPNAPVVIVGMHRSGTSLITRMLKQMGLFTGAILEQNDESPLFIALNDQILSIAHATWDYPEAFANIYTDDSLVTKAADIAKEHLLSPENLRLYLPPQAKSISDLSGQLWGWKDPRTTVTWPIWKKIFPEMRILFVSRNGVDVAASLQRRAEKDKQQFVSTPSSAAVRQTKFMSLRCLSLESAFELWASYNETFFRLLNSYQPVSWKQISYEDFIESPEKTLATILSFLASEVPAYPQAEYGHSVIPGRRYAFREDPKLLDFYDKVADEPLMQKLGYGNLHSKL